MARDTGALALKADLAEPQGPAELADAALQVAATDANAPGIDILINNAGVGWCGPVGEMSGDKITEILAVNLAAPIELTRRLLPRMTARGSGRIVFVSSIVGATSVREEAVYSAGEAGRQLRREPRSRAGRLRRGHLRDRARRDQHPVLRAPGPPLRPQ